MKKLLLILVASSFVFIAPDVMAAGPSFTEAMGNIQTSIKSLSTVIYYVSLLLGFIITVASLIAIYTKNKNPQSQVTWGGILSGVAVGAALLSIAAFTNISSSAAGITPTIDVTQGIQ